MRKRPEFKEKKIPVDSREANLVWDWESKLSRVDHPTEGNERKEDSSNDRC